MSAFASTSRLPNPHFYPPSLRDLSKPRSHTNGRRSSGPGGKGKQRTLQDDLDELDADEDEYYNNLMDVRQYGYSWLVPLGRQNTHDDDAESAFGSAGDQTFDSALGQPLPLDLGGQPGGQPGGGEGEGAGEAPVRDLDAEIENADASTASSSGSEAEDETGEASEVEGRREAQAGQTAADTEGEESYGGGGFLASQGGSQSSPGGGKRSGTQSLRPVTIHQLLNASQAFAEAEFYVDGAEIKDITLVACIRNVSVTATQVTLLVEDGTGQMDARSWLEPDAEESGLREEYAVNSYVRILGSLKTFSQKRHINVTRFRKIDDHNEVLFHAMECVYVHKYFTQGPPGGTSINAINSTTYDSGANPYAGDGGAGSYGGGGGAGGGGDLYSELPQGQRQIMHWVVQQTQSGEAGEEGVNVNAIVRGVGGPAGKIKAEVENLIADGHLYQTIDDDHVLPTSS
ncbi:hypothetical protein JCM8547_002926 [Rhodosporidiobolus lusitaniae]